MKIGINASFLRKPDTGIGQVTRGFINELLKSGSKENEYFLYLEKDTELKLPKNFHKRVFSPLIWRRDDLLRKIRWEKFLLPRRVKRDNCRVFISLYQCPTFLPKNIKHKMLVHDLIPRVFPEYLDNWRKKFYFYLSAKAVCRADKIFTVSEWSKKDIHKFLEIPEKRIVVANPSVGSEFAETAGEKEDHEILERYGIFGRYIFYVGGFDFRKNVSGLLEAFRKLTDNYEVSGVKLVLGGEDKSKYSSLFTDVKKGIKGLEIEDRVEIAGFVEQKDLPALYRNCDLFIFPSLYEGFGLTPLEAMTAGAPTAVSKSSSLLEVGGDAVLYFNPYDTGEMARVMGKMLGNLNLRRRLSEKGKARAKKFSWKNFTEIILK